MIAQNTLNEYTKVDLMTEVRDMKTYKLLGYSKIYDYNTDKAYVKIDGLSYNFMKIDNYLVVV